MKLSPIFFLGLFASVYINLFPAFARKQKKQKTPPACPYYCYSPQNYTKMSQWCHSQSFCRNHDRRSSQKYKSHRRFYCPSHCLSPYRNYKKMKKWCFAKNICNHNNNKSNNRKRYTPQYLLRRNYSIRDKKHLKVGKKFKLTINNYNTNYQWEISGLPRGAVFNETTRQLVWSPTSYQVGKHILTFTVSDGEKTASKNIELIVQEKWEAYFLPGLSYTGYIPANSEELGIYNGISINYVFISWTHRNNKRGPSHGRVYFKLDIMQSTETEVADLIYWAGGVDLSFERFPKRNFLIPFFGLELGGSYSNRKIAGNCSPDSIDNCTKEIGGVFHITPTFGIHLWVDRNFFVTLSGGYSFPVEDYDNLKGWRVNLGANFTMW
ncbi:MAG: Ig domain-containing protein [Myxococcota bacterium]